MTGATLDRDQLQGRVSADTRADGPAPEPSHPRGYCVLFWGALMLLPLLLAATLALPWLERNRGLNEAIAEGRDQLQRLQRLVASQSTLSAELEQVNDDEDLKAFYFDAPTQALAGADLQRRVQDIVSAAKGRLISTQLLPEEKADHPPRVRLRTQIQGSTETLLDVLHALDQARPFLLVDQVSVRSSARGEEPGRVIPGRPPVRRLPVTEAGELTVRLDIFGFALGAKE